jgi:Peptidase_C39 like family/Tetratricopeptide repeat
MHLELPGVRQRAGYLTCVVLLILAGCAGIPEANYTANRTGRSARVELANVPFYPQEQYQCGPAALAMVFAYAGVPRTPKDITGLVYLPGREGSLQPEMLAATRREGLLPYKLATEPDALLQELAAGHPVVVLLNLRFSFLPEWHYAVLVGYDLTSKEVVLRSGANRRLIMTLHDFDRSWAKSGRWAFVALPPDQIPASARESDYVAAVVALERVSPQSARVAYATALTRWPGDLIARIGLGNVAYGQHDLIAAESEYRRATIDHPDSGDAWNNLAQVLHELGNNSAALEASDRAVAIGGPRLAIYQSTQKAIKAGLASSHPPEQSGHRSGGAAD